MTLRLSGQEYNGDESLPVYEWTTMIKGPAEVLEILLKPVGDNLVCKKVPVAIEHNVCFLLDRLSLKSTNDCMEVRRSGVVEKQWRSTPSFLPLRRRGAAG